MIKVVSYKICPFVQRVTAALESRSIPYEIQFISLSEPPEWFVDVSPNVQVPILITSQVLKRHCRELSYFIHLAKESIRQKRRSIRYSLQLISLVVWIIRGST